MSGHAAIGSLFALVLVALASPLWAGTIVAFGDSTTAERLGVTTYTTVLNGVLDHDTVINAGVGGDTTDDAVARLQSDVLSLSPDVVLIQFGASDQHHPNWQLEEDPLVSLDDYQPVEKHHRGVFQPRQVQSIAPRGSQNNDLRHYFGIASMRSSSLMRKSTGCYVSNLRTIVAGVRGVGATPVLMTPNPWTISRQLVDTIHDPEPNWFLIGYVDAMRDMAESDNVRLIDVFGAWDRWDVEHLGQTLRKLTVDNQPVEKRRRGVFQPRQAQSIAPRRSL